MSRQVSAVVRPVLMSEEIDDVISIQEYARENSHFDQKSLAQPTVTADLQETGDQPGRLAS